MSTVASFDLEKAILAVHDRFQGQEISAGLLALIKSAMLAALCKHYEAGGCIMDCYRQPIEKFEDVDVLVHFMEPTETIKINTARREETMR